MKIGDKMIFRPPLMVGTVEQLFEDGKMKIRADDASCTYNIFPSNVLTTESYKNTNDWLTRR